MTAGLVYMRNTASIQHDIFLSYRHKDGKEFADKLHEALMKRGFRVWFDTVTMQPGNELDHRISDTIRNIGLYIAIITPEFCDHNAFALKEFNLAIDIQNNRHLDTKQRHSDDEMEFIFPILHKITKHDQLPNNDRIKQYLERHLYSDSTMNMNNIVDRIVERCGVIEDSFTEKNIGSIQMGRFPVTNIEYLRFINEGGYTNAGLKKWWSDSGQEFWLHYAARRPHNHFGRKTEGATIRTEDASILKNMTASNTLFNRFNQPVTGVSYYEAEAYCRWRNDIGGLPGIVRLPTQSEWLNAALRENERYPWGNSPPSSQLINIVDKSSYTVENISLETINLEDIGKINIPSPFGTYPGGMSHNECYHMFGNVWEWLGDWLSSDEANELADGDPHNIGKIAGYCCFDTVKRLETWKPITYRRPGYRHHVIGFRVALELPEP